MAGILSDVTGVGEAVQGASTIATTLEEGLFKIFPGLDKGDAAKFAQAMQEKLLAQDQAQEHDQSEITKVEASNTSLFISGARPALLWVCVGGVAWNYVGAPIILFILAAFGHKGDIFPQLDSAELMALVTSLLGLSGYHMVERLNGIAPAAEGTITTKTIRKALPVK